MLDRRFDVLYKKKLIDTLDYLIGFLNSKGLRWWLAYGSIIGAVRHKGIIPWDDDIDIWMPREDYQRLLSYHKEFENEKYYLGHVSIDDNYGARFMKAMDKTTTIQPQSFIPSVMGIFVDIFPLDSSNDRIDIILDRIQLVNKKWSEYYAYFMRFSFGDIIASVKHPVTLLGRIRTNLKNNKEKEALLKTDALALDQQASNEKFETAKYCYSLYGFYGERDVFSASWFIGYKEVPFESIKVRIPVGYHELLTTLYGDYMTPPPLDKRVALHAPYYINLKEQLSLDEVNERIKNGEKIVY